MILSSWNVEIDLKCRKSPWFWLNDLCVKMDVQSLIDIIENHGMNYPVQWLLHDLIIILHIEIMIGIWLKWDSLLTWNMCNEINKTGWENEEYRNIMRSEFPNVIY